MAAAGSASNGSRIVVVGGGVIGLSTALRLLQNKSGSRDVTVVSDVWTPNTTSDVSGAIWVPFTGAATQTEQNKERYPRWGQDTLQHFVSCYTEFGPLRTGISLRSGYMFPEPSEVAADLKRDPNGKGWPYWADTVMGFRAITDVELQLLHQPKGQIGWFFTTFVVDVTLYLPFLMAQIKALGGNFVTRKLVSLDELKSDADVIVNCSGIGARQLVGDTALHATRGQVVKLQPHPVLSSHFVLDDRNVHGAHDPADAHTLSYIFPRIHDLVLGSTYQHHNDDKRPDPADTQGILTRAARFLPDLKTLTTSNNGTSAVLTSWVGLRPYREVNGVNDVRLEVESRPAAATGPIVVHAYGHGGSGVTNSWGTAGDVVSLVATAAGAGSDKAPKIRSKL